MTMSDPKQTHRAWTRAQDYWPPRAASRSWRKRRLREESEAAASHDDPAAPTPTTVQRSLLASTLFVLLGLSVLAFALLIAVWPAFRAEPATTPALSTSAKPLSTLRSAG